MAISIPKIPLTEIVKIGATIFLIFLGLRTYHWYNSQLDRRDAKQVFDMAQDRERQIIYTNQQRALTQIVKSDDDTWKDEIRSLKKDNIEMMALIKKNGEEVKNIGIVSATINENVSLRLKEISDHSYKQGTGDPNEQYFKKITASEKDKEGKEITIPIGWSIYYPNKREWKTGVYPLEYKTKIIQTEQKDGQWNSYVEAWAENNKDDESEGLKLPMKVDAQFIQLKKDTTEFFWWNPHVNLNVDASLDKAGGGISFSTSGYGRTKNDLIWRFMDFGISSDGDDFWVKVSPVSYNIGEILPLVSNTFLAPYIGYDFKKNVFGLSLSVPF